MGGGIPCELSPLLKGKLQAEEERKVFKADGTAPGHGAADCLENVQE